MGFFQKKVPLEKEWERLMKEERKFLVSRAEKKDTFMNQKLTQMVPDKLQETLDNAFAKGFGLIFEKGTGVIEKTYNKDEMEKKTIRLWKALEDCRNELCLKCGKFHEAHLGACDGCRWKGGYDK